MPPFEDMSLKQNRHESVSSNLFADAYKMLEEGCRSAAAPVTSIYNDVQKKAKDVGTPLNEMFKKDPVNATIETAEVAAIGFGCGMLIVGELPPLATGLIIGATATLLTDTVLSPYRSKRFTAESDKPHHPATESIAPLKAVPRSEHQLPEVSFADLIMKGKGPNGASGADTARNKTIPAKYHGSLSR